MNVTEYLEVFFRELNLLLPVRGYATYDHSIGMNKDGGIEIRLSAVDWYKVAETALDPDPVKAAHDAARTATRWPDS
jgi:hypothetical protein